MQHKIRAGVEKQLADLMQSMKVEKLKQESVEIAAGSAEGAAAAVAFGGGAGGGKGWGKAKTSVKTWNSQFMSRRAMFEDLSTVAAAATGDQLRAVARH